MKIALTGASSTGKTTLANHLIECSELNMLLQYHLNADARRILDEMGKQSVDDMNATELQTFQRDYFRRKKEQESDKENFITERSFIDIAVYWLLRDAVDANTITKQEMVDKCKEEALRYDLHIFLPFGVIPFVEDGYRSTNITMHKEHSELTKQLLDDWEVLYIELSDGNLDNRIAIAKESILRLKSQVSKSVISQKLKQLNI